jgi:hypothetical protein
MEATPLIDETATAKEAAAVPAWMSDWTDLLSEKERQNVRFREFGDGWFMAVVPFMFTAGLIVGRMDNGGNYENRWCYENLEAAYAAFDAWDGQGEPMGWHRHPMTGRRRIDGDPAREYINI